MDIVSAMNCLISKPVPQATKKQVDEYSNKVITLRPEPELRNFLEVRSKNIGDMSVSALCTALLEAYRKADSVKTELATAMHLTEVKLSANRIRKLFHLHDYNVHGTIDILQKYDVAFTDYFDDIRLAAKLHGDGFSDLSKVFSVSKDWLTGKSDQVRKLSDFSMAYEDVISKVQKLHKDRRLNCFCPFCPSDALVGQRIDRSEDNPSRTDVGIVLLIEPEEGFKHRTIEVYGPTSFLLHQTRTQFKVVMMAAYKICGPTTFVGRHFKPDVMSDLISGKNLLRAEDLETASDSWDAECYLGETVGNAEPIEKWEVYAVEQSANLILSQLTSR